MLAPDVNVLVYANRRDTPGHDAYREWLERLSRGPEPFALSVLSAVGFVRVAKQDSNLKSLTILGLCFATRAVSRAKARELIGIRSPAFAG